MGQKVRWLFEAVSPLPPNCGLPEHGSEGPRVFAKEALGTAIVDYMASQNHAESPTIRTEERATYCATNRECDQEKVNKTICYGAG